MKGCDLIKNIVSIELGEKYINVDIIRKKYKSIYIDKSIKFQANLNKIEYKNYIKELSNNIKSKIESYKYKYKYMNINVQNENVIIRNFKILNVNKKKDVVGMIVNEINQYLPINVNDYVIKHKVLSSSNDYLQVQAILLPKYIIEISKYISNETGVALKMVSINFDILQKIIDLGYLENECSNCVFIEEKQDDYIFNIVESNKIIESYNLNKSYQSEEFINKMINEKDNIFYYGDVNEFNDKINKKNNSLQILKFNNDINIFNIEDNTDKIKSVNSIGMII